MKGFSFSSLPPEEKERIMTEVIKGANAEQKALMDRYRKLEQEEKKNRPAN